MNRRNNTFRNPLFRMIAEAQEEQQMQRMMQQGGMPQGMPQGVNMQQGMGGMQDMDEEDNFADDPEMDQQGGNMQGGDEDFDMTQETADEAMGQMGMDNEGGAQPFSQNEDVDSIVTNIREMCLKGLQMLADDIEDPAYDLLKKMWLMCDKAQTPEDENAQGQK